MVWSSGDFPDIAKMIEPASTAIVEGIGIGPGDKVLDIATGTGNLAIPAAKLGAEVVGLDLTPELLEVARERAAAEGVAVEWVEGDAEALDYPDNAFDHVVSAFGMIFAPRHELAAAEMTRVCRPGGNLAMTSWNSEGLNGSLFQVMGKHLPAPPEKMATMVDWGSPQYIIDHFAPHGVNMRVDQEFVEFKAASADAWVAYNEDKLGPMLMAKNALTPQGKWDALRAAWWNITRRRTSRPTARGSAGPSTCWRPERKSASCSYQQGCSAALEPRTYVAIKR